MKEGCTKFQQNNCKVEAGISGILWIPNSAGHMSHRPISITWIKRRHYVYDLHMYQLSCRIPRHSLNRIATASSILLLVCNIHRVRYQTKLVQINIMAWGKRKEFMEGATQISLWGKG